MSADSTDSPRPLGEISQEPAAFEQFLDRNQKRLIALAALIAIGATGFVIYRSIQTSTQEAAGKALHSAEEISALQEVITEFPDTNAAGSARLLLADKQWQEGQQDAAIATLSSFISENPEHPARHTARASLGSKLISQGKAEEAKTAFEAIVSDPEGEFLAPFALISLGDIARLAGDTTAAEAYYQQANNDYPGNSFNQTATSRLSLLKAKLPTEIEPPPAPETTPAPNPLTPPPFLTPNAPSPGAAATEIEVAPAPDAETAPETPEATPETPEESPEGEPAAEPAEAAAEPETEEAPVESEPSEP